MYCLSRLGYGPMPKRLWINKSFSSRMKTFRCTECWIRTTIAAKYLSFTTPFKRLRSKSALRREHVNWGFEPPALHSSYNTVLSLVGDEVSHYYDILKYYHVALAGFEPAILVWDSMAVNALPYFVKHFGALQTLSISSHSWNGIFHALRGLTTFTAALPFKLQGRIKELFVPRGNACTMLNRITERASEWHNERW